MKIIKRLFMCTLALIMCFAFYVKAFSYDKDKKIIVEIEGNFFEVEKNDIIFDETIFLPFRKVMDSIGFDIKWNDFNKTVCCYKDEKEVSFEIGKNKVDVNGNEILIDFLPKIVNNTMFVPVDLLEKGFGITAEPDTVLNFIELNYKQEVESNIYNIKDFDGEIIVNMEVQTDNEFLSAVDYDGTFGKNSNAEVSQIFLDRKKEKAEKIFKNNIVSAKKILKNRIKNLGYRNIVDLQNEAKEYRSKYMYNFKSYECKVLYKLQIFDNFISITEFLILDKGNGEIIKDVMSNTYEIDSGKKVDFNSISMKMFGESEDYVLEYVKKAFLDKVNEKTENFFDNAETIIKNFNSQNFYFSKKGLNFYFNCGEIAPKENGFIEILLPIKLIFMAK